MIPRSTSTPYGNLHRDQLTTMITYALIYHYDNGTRSCANRITHTHIRTEHKTYFLISTAFTGRVHVVRQPICACAEGQGGADSCAFGRGGADSTTFDLKTKWGFSCLLKMLSEERAAKIEL